MSTIEVCEGNIDKLTYDIIDCMSPADADEWAEMLDFDYESDRELKQVLKLKVTEFKHKQSRQSERGSSAKMTYKDILNEEREKRLRLIRNLSEFEKSVQELRKMAKSGKNQTIARIAHQTERFEEKKNEFMKDFLAVKANPIFITGETSAGKSSFINLLLNDDIMPVDFDQSSSTFCIIRKNETKRAMVYYKAASRRKEVIENLESKDFNETVQKYLASKRNDVAYVELMCPSEVLQDDIVIMDSPGMGAPDFSEELKKQISDSCAFVYVLKHFNPIGEDCSDHAKLVKRACRGNRDYSVNMESDAMVFIVNKWDTVQRAKADTYKGVVRRLRDYLGNVSESRVLTMSVRDAAFMQSKSVIAEDYKKFLELLHSLQISAITNRTRMFHSLVVDYMNSIVETLEFLGHVLATTMKDRQSKADILDDMREKIKDKLDIYYNVKKEFYESIIEQRTKELRCEMKKPEHENEMLQQFLELMSHTIPYAINHDDMNQQVIQLAADKLSIVMETQEKKDHYFHAVRSTLIKEFFLKFHEFEVTMKETQQNLFEGYKINILGKDKTLVEKALPHWSKLTLKQKIIFGVSMPVYAPFIVGVFLVSFNAKIFEKLYKMLPKNDRLVTLDERKEYVYRRSHEIFNRYTDKTEYINAYVREIMKDVWETLENLYEGSKRQLEELRDNARVLREENNEDRGIIKSSRTLRTQLQHYLETLYRFEFECLQYDQFLQESLFKYDNIAMPISYSTNSAIYAVTATDGAMADMAELGPSVTKASLKRVFWKVMADNVHDLQIEIQMCILHSSKNPDLLRMIKVVKSAPNCEVINVSLLCEAVSMSFRTYLRRETQDKNGLKKFHYMYDKFYDIHKGLLYLHLCEEKSGNKVTYLTGYELNLDTIMVTLEGKVKLMNLKLPGDIQFPVTLTQDLVHGYRHIPPPVILNERVYDAAADIYSLAIAQFEGWFNAEAFLEFTFARNSPKDTLYKFVDGMKDPAEVLSCGPHEIDLRNDKYARIWFRITTRLINDYMKEKIKLTASEWPSYFNPIDDL